MITSGQPIEKRRKYKVDADTAEAMRALRKEGKPITEIARRFGIHHATVSYWTTGRASNYKPLGWVSRVESHGSKCIRRSTWKQRRRTPYSARGIETVSCIRCHAPAVHQWQVCADGRVYRPLCLACDIALNRLVLEWAGDPEAKAKCDTYEAEQRGVT